MLIRMLSAVILSLFLFFIVHVVVFRCCCVRERFRTIKRIFAATLPVYLMLFLLLPEFPVTPPTVAYGTLGLFLLALLFGGYCSLYFVADRSLSARLPLHIRRSPHRSLSRDELRRAYDAEAYLEGRLRHLEYGGYLSRTGDCYRNTARGDRLALLTGWLRSLLRLPDDRPL